MVTCWGIFATSITTTIGPSSLYNLMNCCNKCGLALRICMNNIRIHDLRMYICGFIFITFSWSGTKNAHLEREGLVRILNTRIRQSIGGMDFLINDEMSMILPKILEQAWKSVSNIQLQGLWRYGLTHGVLLSHWNMRLSYLSYLLSHIYMYDWCAIYGVCEWSSTLWPTGRALLFALHTISL